MSDAKKYWVKDWGNYWNRAYTLEELKEYFSPFDTDGELIVNDELFEQYKEINSIEDLEEYLSAEAAGMSLPYSFEEF